LIRRINIYTGGLGTVPHDSGARLGRQFPAAHWRRMRVNDRTVIRGGFGQS
jgi:hypothetical protein